MALNLETEEFAGNLKQGNCLLLDVRSEGEYGHGHIPGAINLPLLNNDERTQVGTAYVQQGRQPAVRKGFELVGGKFVQFIDRVKEISNGEDLYIYCWRGGMRSNIMAWVLGMAGYKVVLLKGGYKQFRKWALNQLIVEKKIVVLGGKTGTGKTELLLAMKQQGATVVDLEGFAHHRGSIFGSLGQLPQPTQEQFENSIAWQWSDFKNDEVIWLENESRLIGHVRIPDKIYESMRQSPVLEVQRNFEERLKRIVVEYGCFDKAILAEKTKKVEKRLGGLRLKQALGFLDNNEIENWAAIMLRYYDGTYDHSNLQRDKTLNFDYEFDELKSMPDNATGIIQQLKTITATESLLQNGTN